MKRTLILAIWLAVNAWAQNPPPKRPANPSAAMMPKPASSSTQAARKAVPPSSVQARPLSAPAKAAAAQPPQQRAARPAMNPGRTPSTSMAQSSTRRPRSRHRLVQRPVAGRAVVARNGKSPKGERDPFVSPIVERKYTPISCTGSGRQCLVVGEITLNGVVRSPGGFIAVVVNGEHTYFLRKDDPLADGAVEKITLDAITLRQRSSDALGRPVVREVTKKLGVPAG